MDRKTFDERIQEAALHTDSVPVADLRKIYFAGASYAYDLLSAENEELKAKASHDLKCYQIACDDVAKLEANNKMLKETAEMFRQDAERHALTAVTSFGQLVELKNAAQVMAGAIYKFKKLNEALKENVYNVGDEYEQAETEMYEALEAWDKVKKCEGKDE